MKIAFTGGGSGGHFYPIIAVAEAIHEIEEERRLVDIELTYYNNEPYDARALFDNEIKWKYVTSGKNRPNKRLLNFLDSFKIIFGVVIATWQLYLHYPDVVFGKGGGASFTTLFAARLLRIPVMIHESDTVPGRVQAWAGKFAKRVAICVPEAASHFPKDKTALVGMPVRKLIREPLRDGAYEFLKLERAIPTILVIGGSQGALHINNILLDILPRLLDQYQVIHQTGKAGFDDVNLRASYLLENHPHKERYKSFAYLDVTAMRMSAGIADLVISRAGNTAIFEIASWGKPSILIPMDASMSVGDHQRENAYSFARGGGGIVIEDKNLRPTILRSEIDRVLTDKALSKDMGEKAKATATPQAAKKIAEELIKIALMHES
ncbi:MAG: hypothetical protein COV07_01920 [Candidatus Vogelbacteria bacterium CG10_big_fil_rev_8_21_14_0_10_45_14]|uniref:UDP-N-acetylglucosamine--N-acetylmuramyl-(pentapeptide) pyrophosphoryl-undecaprenol N-acetylglucosamine transferase n=1 Tax=Candidatus Vogelbacteria bacterium CG10_big_fil_rev_8_21_14_0_10_45_14 TaxID=1975042 RepID=A0A2H0RK64_9BACT|nr:MAG: hypothetical protein COV07_01920 [Candidatus Vogelbacteria bacterium CG10_big_fil_rev_8_21_14_0_10_45_14]